MKKEVCSYTENRHSNTNSIQQYIENKSNDNLKYNNASTYKNSNDNKNNNTNTDNYKAFSEYNFISNPNLNIPYSDMHTNEDTLDEHSVSFSLIDAYNYNNLDDSYFNLIREEQESLLDTDIIIKEKRNFHQYLNNKYNFYNTNADIDTMILGHLYSGCNDEKSNLNEDKLKTSHYNSFLNIVFSFFNSDRKNKENMSNCDNSDGVYGYSHNDSSCYFNLYSVKVHYHKALMCLFVLFLLLIIGIQINKRIDKQSTEHIYINNGNINSNSNNDSNKNITNNLSHDVKHNTHRSRDKDNIGIINTTYLENNKKTINRLKARKNNKKPNTTLFTKINKQEIISNIHKQNKSNNNNTKPIKPIKPIKGLSKLSYLFFIIFIGISYSIIIITNHLSSAYLQKLSVPELSQLKIFNYIFNVSNYLGFSVFPIIAFSSFLSKLEQRLFKDLKISLSMSIFVFSMFCSTLNILISYVILRRIYAKQVSLLNSSNSNNNGICLYGNSRSCNDNRMIFNLNEDFRKLLIFKKASLVVLCVLLLVLINFSYLKVLGESFIMYFEINYNEYYEYYLYFEFIFTSCEYSFYIFPYIIITIVVFNNYFFIWESVLLRESINIKFSKKFVLDIDVESEI